MPRADGETRPIILSVSTSTRVVGQPCGLQCQQTAEIIREDAARFEPRVGRSIPSPAQLLLREIGVRLDPLPVGVRQSGGAENLPARLQAFVITVADLGPGLL